MNTSALFLWLFLGSLLQLFGFGRWMTPVAAWLVPALLLHFAHGLPPVAGALWIWLALSIPLAISLRGAVPIPGLAYLALPVGLGLFTTLPFLVDRLGSPLVPGAWATLVFPVTFTAVQFLIARANPYGTWGAIGYTQHGVLPLMQLASVAGVWGIGFLVVWFGSVVGWAWDQQFAWDQVREGVVAFAGVGGLAFLLGGLRVAFAPARQTVRIAGIGWPEGIVERADFMRAVLPDFTDEEEQKLRPAFAQIQEAFLERSAREARAGSKIIVWPEVSLLVFQDGEAAFLERARDFVREHRVHLVMGMATVRPRERHSFRNHAVLLTPEGETAYDYTKITAVPGFEQTFSLPGDQPIPFAETPYGRVASPICYDMDFPWIVRQVGRGRADLMLVPASDWKEIVPLHQPMAEFRAIENGAALFRITRWGGSGAIDPYGRRLASMNDFNTDDNVMVAHVPVKAGARTAYARFGDLFAWACVAAMALGAVLWVMRAVS